MSENKSIPESEAPEPALQPPSGEPHPASLEAYHEKPSLYQRVTKSIPLLITVIVHLILFIAAGAFVIQEQIVGKKTKFESGNANVNEAPQVEHRLQVARRSGSASSASTPVSANRIYSTAAGALQLPEMPELPSMGAGGFGGFGNMGAGLGLGSGTSMNSGLGGGGLGGRGFMSVSFLGMTNQNVSKLVFIVDVSRGTMQEGKGGFEAFSVIREEIMRLIAGMPPSAEFNVILYENASYTNAQLNLFAKELVPATVANKDNFIKWLTPVNSSLNRLGIGSATTRTYWRPKALPDSSGIDNTFHPANWVNAVRCALEMQPDTIFAIISTKGRPQQGLSDSDWQRALNDYKSRREDALRRLKSEGTTEQEVSRARYTAYAKARREFDAANRAIVAKKRPPIVISSDTEIFSNAVQTRLRKEGFPITLSKEGWTGKDGQDLTPPGSPSRYTNASWNDQILYMARLQRALVPERAALNLFLFTGTKAASATDTKDLSSLASRNGGRFEVLTNQRLKELKAQADQ